MGNNNYKNQKLGFLLLVFLSLSSASFAKPQMVLTDEILQAQWRQLWFNDIWQTPDFQYPFKKCFKKAAEDREIPLALLVAVAKGESNFDPQAKSNKNAYGIMQIQWPGTARDLGIFEQSDLVNKPCLNISAGADYLKMLLNRYDFDIHRALAAYNYGPGRIPTGEYYEALPKGAQWYSRYILNHINGIIRLKSDLVPYEFQLTTLEPKQRIQHSVLAKFKEKDKARHLSKFLRMKIPSYEFDWLDRGSNNFVVVLTYENNNQKQQAKSKLANYGFSIH